MEVVEEITRPKEDFDSIADTRRRFKTYKSYEHYLLLLIPIGIFMLLGIIAIIVLAVIVSKQANAPAPQVSLKVN